MWDTQTLKCLSLLKGQHQRGVCALDFSGKPIFHWSLTNGSTFILRIFFLFLTTPYLVEFCWYVSSPVLGWKSDILIPHKEMWLLDYMPFPCLPHFLSPKSLPQARTVFCIYLSDLKSRAAVAVERLSCKCLAVTQTINFNSPNKGEPSTSDLN